MKDVEIIEQIPQIDWWYVVIAMVVLLVVIEVLWSLLDKFFVERLGIETKKMKQRRLEREQLRETTELAKTTAANLDILQKRHSEDEKAFRKSLNNYMEESRKDRKALHEEMIAYSNNRVNDRKQSLEIQKELKDSIASRDVQINALMDANKETLAAKINEKYKYYISIGGIPEDEYDEFVGLHRAYKGVGGNSHGDAKFEYCMEHLPILPVDIKLVIKH